MRSMTSGASKQRGVVSLIVTMIMMIVITLIVLGFAEVARNEQRSNLDNQLSTQAYYAAESGINDAQAIIKQAIAGGGTAPDNPGCVPQGAYSGLDQTVDATHNVSYTCLIVDTSPPMLHYTVGYDSTVVPLTSNNPSFGKITLSWQVPSGLPSTAAGCYTNLANLRTYPVAAGTGAWGCNYPILRVDLVDADGALARSNWDSLTSTMFFVPFDSTSIGNSIGWGANGNAVPARCDDTSCLADVTGLGGKTYYMRITTIYRSNSRLEISSAGNKFVGAQATIDSTGKAQDVLRRVLVAVDLTDANKHAIPSGSIVSRDSVCKRFSVTSGSFQVYSDAGINLGAGAFGNTYCTVTSLGSPKP